MVIEKGLERTLDGGGRSPASHQKCHSSWGNPSTAPPTASGLSPGSSLAPKRDWEVYIARCGHSRGKDACPGQRPRRAQAPESRRFLAPDVNSVIEGNITNPPTSSVMR